MDADLSVLVLQAEADEFAASAAAAAAGKPLPTQAESARAPPQIPMNQTRGPSLADSRNSSREFSASRGPSLDQVAPHGGVPLGSVPLTNPVEQSAVQMDDQVGVLQHRALEAACSCGVQEALPGGMERAVPVPSIFHYLSVKEQISLAQSILGTCVVLP